MATSTEVQLPEFGSSLVAEADITFAGYESRASHAVRAGHLAASRRLVLTPQAQRVFAFEENRRVLLTPDGASVSEIVENERQSLRQWFATCASEGIDHFAVDISSMPRSCIAAVLVELERLSRHRKVFARLHYTLAAFREPFQEQVSGFGLSPVLGRFAGWFPTPDKPLCLVLGLGYEQDRGIGAREYLEPGHVMLLVPSSPIKEYRTSVVESNRVLLDNLASQNVIDYDVLQPAETYSLLRSTVFRLTPRFNTIVLPSGPKILAGLSMLVALGRRDLSVWRMSGGDREPAVDRKGTEYFASIWFSLSEGRGSSPEAGPVA